MSGVFRPVNGVDSRWWVKWGQCGTPHPQNTQVLGHQSLLHPQCFCFCHVASAPRSFTALLTEQVGRQNGKWEAWHPDPRSPGPSSGHLLFLGPPLSLPLITLDGAVRTLCGSLGPCPRLGHLQLLECVSEDSSSVCSGLSRWPAFSWLLGDGYHSAQVSPLGEALPLHPVCSPGSVPAPCFILSWAPLTIGRSSLICYLFPAHLGD